MTEKEKLERRLEKIKADEEKVKQRMRQIARKEKEAERKINTRKKILIGGTIMAAVRNNDIEWKPIKKLLNKYLTKEREREIFQLPPLPVEAKGEEE